MSELALDPLEREQTASLAALVLGGVPAPALARAVHDRTQGVPFFVEELCAALAGAGRIVETGPGLALAGEEDIPLPDSVRDAILARAAHLSADARRVLEVASIVGPRFDLALVADLVGDAAIDEPMSIGIVVQDESGVATFPIR